MNRRNNMKWYSNKEWWADTGDVREAKYFSPLGEE